ncbi:MAG TPA: response regulator [Polyangiaceae bacterium]|nr:response regulator [Polyangiaceae bacterium]
MQITLRTKLLLIVSATALTLLTNIVVSRIMAVRQIRDLIDMEGRIVPRLSLEPQIQSSFDHLRQDLQNAVAAQDQAALNATIVKKDALLKLISTTGGAISDQDSATLRHSIGDYYAAAEGVSRRMITGETGEALGPAIEAMQTKQALVAAAIENATALKNNELSDAFTTVREANERASYFRLTLGIAAIGLILVLSIWAGRGTLKAVNQLTSGFARFATGSFSEPIHVSSRDELGDIAREANRMAATLQQTAEERDRTDWMKESLAKLSDEVRGDLSPEQVTQRALHFLATRVNALVATFHVANDAGVFRLVSQYGLASGSPLDSFHLNQGLSGRAVAANEIVVVDDPPANYLTVRSSLGESSPRSVVLVPLSDLGNPLALIEFALLERCPPRVLELLSSMRAGLVVALLAAQANAQVRELLIRAQAQAEQLAAQEEELRVNNQELESQQEVLRSANEELEAQRQSLSEKNSELEQARKGLVDKANQLTQMSSYKSQFLSNMSHELRTPLNSMLILSHLLAENEGSRLSEKQVEHAKTIHSAGKDLLRLINEVLDLAKIEAGRQEVYAEPVDLAQMAAHLKRVFQPLAAEKGVKLALDIAPEAPAFIATDRHRLDRILTNLVGNAIKFTDHGSVTIRIQRPPAGARFERSDLDAEHCVAFVVDDTGIGIDAAHHARVFAPFEQIDSGANRRHAGTGLGLAISRESAKLLGGELQLASTPGVGSTFTCYLPEKIQSIGDAAEALPAAVAPMAPDVSASKIHVLVIEDDPVLAEQLTDAIEARNLTARVAGTGKEGLALARELRPRGIVLDVKLPDIDGWQVMERLRKDPVTSGIPVHFISAVDSPQRGFALGAIGYLTKPVSRDELVGVVRVLVPSVGQKPRILVVEDNANEGASLVALLDNEDVELLHVQSAREALGALEQQTVGCMILDLGLPDMDGLGLLEQLRARSHIKWPRVVVHTGRALTKKETHALEAYAEAIILKGGSSAERLLEEVRLFVRHVKDKFISERPMLNVSRASSDISFEGIKLLLAEDDMRTVYAVSALLRGKGAQVLVAETGREALELLDQNADVAAVLMDVMMPEMDGYEAMRQIRADQRFSGLPVIALTAKAMKGERERCLEAGASDYLTKPVDSDRLLTTLTTWLQQGAAPDAQRTS